MKKRIMACIIASAMIAASAVTTVSYADNSVPALGMDNPFSGCFEDEGNGEWTINARGMKLITENLSNIEALNLRFTLNERTEDSMIWHFAFVAGDKTYETDYIMMIPMFSAEEGNHLYLPLADILGAVNDSYPDEMIPFADIEYGTITDANGFISDIEITANSVFPSLAGHVWAAYDKGADGAYTELSTCFIFTDEENGRTYTPGINVGTGFTYTQDDNKMELYFGAISETPVQAELSVGESGDIFAFIDYGEVQKTYKLSLLPAADPASYGMAPGLAGTTWLAYGEAEDGSYTDLWSCIVFNEDGTGSMNDPALDIGLPFSFEQDDFDLMLHIGDADDSTPVLLTLDGTDLYAEFTFSDIVKKAKLEMWTGSDDSSVDDAQDEAAGAVESPDFVKDGNTWMLTDAAAKVSDINGTAGGNVGLAINYVFPLSNGFDLTFVFVASDGTQHPVKAKYSGAIDNDTIFVKVRDLLLQAKISPDDVAGFGFIDNTSSDIVSVTVGMGSPSYQPIEFPAATVSVITADDTENPKTGVGLTAAAAALAAGAAAVALRKRR